MYHLLKIYNVWFLSILLWSNVLFSHTRDPKFEQISIDQGLSHPAVYCILQDSNGFLWFGTRDGLNRYDGYNFTIFKHDPYENASISHNWITALCQTDPNTIWIGTNEGGLNKFNQRTNTFFRYQYQPEKSSSIPDDRIQALLMDSDSLLWIGTAVGLTRLNLATMVIERFPLESIHSQHIESLNVLAVYEDKKKEIWIGTKSLGLLKFDRASAKFKTFLFKAERTDSNHVNTINKIYEDGSNCLWLGTAGAGMISFDRETGDYLIHQNKNTSILGSGLNNIYDILEGENGNLWIGTGGGGINLFDRRNCKFYGHQCEMNTVCCMGNNTIHSIFRDRSGIVWLGTDCCGLNKSFQENTNTTYYGNNLQNPNTLSQGKVWSLLEDSSGTLWIATSDGLKEFIPASNRFVYHTHDPLNPSSLSNNAVTVIFEDSNQNLWIGTQDGLNLLDNRTNRFIHYHFDPNDPFSISDNGIVSIAEDSLGFLWIGTRLGGLNRFDRSTGKFNRFVHDPNDPTSISRSAIMMILASRNKKSLWIGMYNGGLLAFDQQSGKFKHYIHEKDNPNSISHNSVYSIHEDNRGVLWIGTNGGGLNKFEPNTSNFRWFKEKDGLLSNDIFNIIDDNQGNIWLNTSKGLCFFSPLQEKFYNYHHYIGLQSSFFDRGAFYKNSSGDFYYGSVNGIFKFSPDKLKLDSNIPTIALTGFSIHNKPMHLLYPFPTLREINLAFDQNYFSFEFAVLDYRNPAANQFAHRLEGLENEWIYTGTDRFVRYTNISPGNYTLHVKGCNSNGVWNDKGISIKLHVAPPLWRTYWALALYVFILSGFVYGVWRTSIRRERLKNQLLFERFKAERLQEMDQLKSRFFANISHEFRTPLTMIMGPIESLRNKINDRESREDLSLMKKNAKKVLNLINQLLDLSKIESGKMPLRVKQQNIVAFLKEIILAFAPLAERKKVSLSFITDKNDVEAYFDSVQIDKMISNLLSNAIKFTPAGGVVTVSLISHPNIDKSYVPKPLKKGIQSSWGDRWVQISVSDTGPGIPPEQIKKIFDHFYKGSYNNSENNEGFGIGLALTKELVELHKGKIIATSNLAEGTTFTITLPLGRDHFSEQEIDLGEVLTGTSKSFESVSYDLAHTRAKLDDPGKNIDKNLPLILIVEDNLDVRNYIRKSINEFFQVIEAENGNEGVQKALEHIPDLIISDVMMPGLNGIKLCKKIKSNEMTSHIPIILLTVRSSDEDKLEGLESGADDYITKPFDTKELFARIKNLVNQRRRLREHFISNWDFELKNIIISTLDERFLQRAISVIEKHISDSEFNVELFCKELGVSRSQLHRKLTALTNQSSSKFIRTLRIKHAASLLASNAGNVFEVSQMVGFNNLSYFAKCFYEQFGVSPSKYISNIRKS